MKLSEKQIIFSKNVAKLIVYADECLGIDLTFGEAYRTADQQYLYYHGLTFKNDSIQSTRRSSWTMNSNHLSRLAVDFNFFINGKLTYKKEDIQELGDYWETLHPKNKWGGNYPKKKEDTPHFEMNP